MTSIANIASQAFCIRLDKLMISPDQCRAARALLNWSQTKFASKASIARATLAEFESGKRVPILNNLNSIKNTFTQEGIEFIPENGGGVGVRLRKANNVNDSMSQHL